ncbi:MAG: DUF2207 domain-containing protein [Bacilli bacterium]|nr:DUF2207 domain-containing protein [Bacilli bacterium]
MKKALLITLSLLLFFIPAGAKAYGIEKFYMNTTVLSNGDMEVEEFFKMNGDYNGFERILNYTNPNASVFDQNASSFGGSTLHNGSGITITKVGGVPLTDVVYEPDNMEAMFEKIRNSMEDFKEVSVGSASNGTYGVYEISKTASGDNVKIYNDKSSRGFYVKYTLQNMAIVHNDVAEIGYNIFSDALVESIGDFRMLITIPGNQTELRAWAHGPLTGNIALDGKNKIRIDIAGLSAQTAMDTRFVFDKAVIPQSQKVSGVNGLEPILAYEKVQADNANAQREAAKEELRKQQVIVNIGNGISIVWMLGLIFMTIRAYKKYDKEYTSSFKGKYFRDFPSEANPEIVGYLMNQKVGTNDLSASILNLIYKKKIGYEKISDKDYKLVDLGNRDNINFTEEKIFALLFKKGTTETTLKEFKNRAKKEYEGFLSDYALWHREATATGKEQNFFEKRNSSLTFFYLYAILGILIGSLFLMVGISPLFVIDLLLGIALLIYYGTITRRTKEANEEYSKWKGLKNFLQDFGQFKKRELPQIELWEKYLVYAVDFGIAEKLAKQMAIKVQEYNLDAAGTPYIYTHSYFTDMLLFNSLMNRSVTTAHSSAISARDVANSSSSSSGGFGGGFSGGGGSFGGGGGGGRF